MLSYIQRVNSPIQEKMKPTTFETKKNSAHYECHPPVIASKNVLSTGCIGRELSCCEPNSEHHILIVPFLFPIKGASKITSARYLAHCGIVLNGQSY